ERATESRLSIRMVCKCGCAEGKECTCKDCPDKKGCHKGESRCCCEPTEKTSESEKAKECSKCTSK
uniref:Metallothionein n=1 Tax=Parascaris univalens TaxID=6257 RepID=A0A915AMP0_PARUN